MTYPPPPTPKRTDPILDASDVLITALRAALVPHVGLLDGTRAVYWGQGPKASTNALRQSGSSAIAGLVLMQGEWITRNMVGAAGVGGDITVKAQSATPVTAATLLAQVDTALLVLSIPGYLFSARFLRLPTVPERSNITTAAATYRMQLLRA